jgi:hypothetical protein
MTYVEPATGAIFYVESDGRHLAKLEKSGKIDWVEDPRAGSGLPDYRTADPKLVFIGAPQAWSVRHPRKVCRTYIEISFSNSQFGEVDVETGAFYPMGQD